MAEIQTTTLSRQWVLKTALFMILLLGFGVWGLADALYFYPKRGIADASFQLKEFLSAADKAGRLTAANITVADPAAALNELRSREAELAKTAVGDSLEARRAAMDLAKLNWLLSLNKAWRLNTEPRLVASFDQPVRRSIYFDMKAGEGFAVMPPASDRTAVLPQGLLDELSRYWNTNPKVTALSGFDMLFQWIFVVIGLGGGAWILVSLLRASARRYTFEPAAQKLTLPGGESLLPADIDDFDKRQWHKYFVTLITREGRHIKLDLLRYVPLEEWVLAMERTRFPERAAEEAAAKAAAEADSEESNPAPADPNT